ncbi:MAG: hypothetical protein AAF363_13800 [Bacteroidota bacterium]
MKYIIQFSLITVLFSILIGYSSCVEDPNPNTGIEIPDTILIDTWAIERFVVDTTDFTEDLQSFTIEFQASGLLEFRENGVLVQIDPILAPRSWSLNIGNTLFISIDTPEVGEVNPGDPNFIKLRRLTPLSQIYVASLVSEERIELFNRNPDITIELILVSP